MINERKANISDLVGVVDPTPVEHIGGPNDGEFRRADDNGARPNGLYVVVVGGNSFLGYHIAAKWYVPR